MAVLVGLLLALVCIGVLTLPFLRSVRQGQVLLSQDPVEEVLARREAVYEEIRILQLDYELGNIGEKEYQTRLQGYRMQAASFLQKQEDLETELRRLDQELEEEILEVRASRNGHSGAAP